MRKADRRKIEGVEEGGQGRAGREVGGRAGKRNCYYLLSVTGHQLKQPVQGDMKSAVTVAKYITRNAAIRKCNSMRPE